MHVFKFHDPSIDVNKQTEKSFCFTEDLLYVPGYATRNKVDTLGENNIKWKNK